MTEYQTQIQQEEAVSQSTSVPKNSCQKLKKENKDDKTHQQLPEEKTPTYQGIPKLIQAGFKPDDKSDDHEFAAYLREKGYQPNQELKLERLRAEFTKIFLDKEYPQRQRKKIKRLDNCLQLRKIYCGNNNFPEQNLSIFSHLVNLEELYIDISNTDTDRGLEHLPDSLEKFYCLANRRKDAKCQAIFNLFANEQGIVETEYRKIKNFPQKLQ
ncbi:5227_t:CDS:2 [Scutellospora calospora]|uniref:5227_t:CDS:1 n=1 Tax=Scutellospora calospora TaxID=85575 RepID=A0ACA9KKG9_9GLOM|nr:5227_t:CDS:2 [Scutellospora calospora]